MPPSEATTAIAWTVFRALINAASVGDLNYNHRDRGTLVELTLSMGVLAATPAKSSEIHNLQTRRNQDLEPAGIRGYFVPLKTAL